MIAAAACQEGLVFPVTLEADAGQRVCTAEIVWGDIHHQGTVGKG
jgi:hypothetical protein